MAEIEVTLFDGRGEALARAQQDVLLSVRDGRQASFHRHFVKGPTIRVETDFHGTPQDAHVVRRPRWCTRSCGTLVMYGRGSPTQRSTISCGAR